MKKVYSWALALISILTAGFTLTSCDEDIIQADYLSGQWRGDFGMYYVDHYNFPWDADYTVIEFYQDGISPHGWGQQYDYYSRGPYKYQYYKFYWSIYDGVIYLKYPSAPALDTYIYEYSMSSRYFSGYFDESTSSFRLAKYRDFDWGGYTYDYHYGYNYGFTYGGYDYGYYYSKTRGESNDSIVTPENADNTLILKRGNRFKEGRNK